MPLTMPSAVPAPSCTPTSKPLTVPSVIVTESKPSLRTPTPEVGAVEGVAVEVERDAARADDQAVLGAVDQVVGEAGALRDDLAAGHVRGDRRRGRSSTCRMAGSSSPTLPARSRARTSRVCEPTREAGVAPAGRRRARTAPPSSEHSNTAVGSSEVKVKVAEVATVVRSGPLRIVVLGGDRVRRGLLDRPRVGLGGRRRRCPARSHGAHREGVVAQAAGPAYVSGEVQAGEGGAVERALVGERRAGGLVVAAAEGERRRAVGARVGRGLDQLAWSGATASSPGGAATTVQV